MSADPPLGVVGDNRVVVFMRRTTPVFTPAAVITRGNASKISASCASLRGFAWARDHLVHGFLGSGKTAFPLPA